MNDSTSNSPIFEQLNREFIARGQSYERMVSRPVLVNPWPSSVEGIRPAGVVMHELQIAPHTPSWAKESLPVREPGESLHMTPSDLVHEAVQQFLGDNPDAFITNMELKEENGNYSIVTEGVAPKEPISVKMLWDSVMYHGPFKPLDPGVSTADAMEGIRNLGRMLTLEKPAQEVLYTGTVDINDFDSVTDSDAYVTELSEQVMADNPEYELTSIHVQDDMFNTSYKILIRGRKRPRD
jgi:hypothetical protein